jgi:DNA-binding HxlR family transcriptional regulator
MKKSKKECAYHCEIEAAFAVIGGKWKAGIIWHIGKEKPRFNELRIPLETISPRMLAKQLRELEADGLVIRTMYPEIPPRVEYELTNAGKAIIPILESISKWVIEYCPEVAKRIE